MVGIKNQACNTQTSTQGVLLPNGNNPYQRNELTIVTKKNQLAKGLSVWQKN